MNKTLKENLYKKEDCKILSLDGGGLRGILTLGVLKRFEKDLQVKHGNKFLLCDHFDIIGGTSTGSIIAAGLALGKSVDELISLYENIGVKVFRKNWFGIATRSWTTIRALNKENYSSRKFEKYLKSSDGFKEITLGDQIEIKCGLVINTKRADTYSLWTVANHPDGKYYEANRDLKLWELCMASSSAPYYFKPKKLRLKSREGKEFDAAFIDGGVSLANNPAWQMFLTATVPSFGFNRSHGETNMLITSIGTGKGIKKEDPDELVNKRALMWASKLADLFMVDALEMNQVILQSFGKNVGPSIHIDSQYGDMSSANYLKEKLFSYQRYNVTLEVESLEKLGFSFTKEKIESLKEMDYFENIGDLLEIGLKLGESLNYETI